MKLLSATLVLFGCLSSGAPGDQPAPNADSLREHFGEPNIEFFTAQSGIAVAVQYGPGRVACDLLIGHAQSLIQRDRQPPPPVSSPAVSDLLQELVPVAMRGKEITTDTSTIGSNTLLTTEYETVSIRRECTSQSCTSSSQNQDIRSLVVFKRSACLTHLN
jgi:hypothetical protein